jgi:hypothetical protein
MKKGTIQKLTRAGVALMAVVVVTLGLSGSAYAESSGYRYGTDSSSPTNGGTSAPYPATFSGGVSLSGSYGGFSRGIGGWGDFDGCGGQANGNSTNSSHANANYGVSVGYGVAGYYWVGGPGRDPAYNQATYSLSTAYNWGYAQGQDAYNKWLYASDVYDGLIWADIEPGFGWEGLF